MSITKIVLATLLGGLVAFVWGAISWMALPWHAAALQPFANEDEVAAAVRANAPAPGVYMLPGHGHEKGDPAAEQDAKERMRQGPVVFAAVRVAGVDPDSPALFLKGLLIQMIGALVLSVLLATLPGLSYWGRVRTVILVALAVGALAHLPYWHWWGFSSTYTLLAILDLLIAWALAGLVMAKIVR